MLNKQDKINKHKFKIITDDANWSFKEIYFIRDIFEI